MRSDVIEVRNPFTRALVGSVPKVSPEQVARALEAAHAYKPALSRHERAAILTKAAQLVRERATELATLITAESGLSLKDSTYETGRVADVLGFGAGEAIAAKAGYRRMVLELGGNDPIIVMDDADLDEASTLAVQGSYKNSGQRCTAIKRMLVHEKVAAAFTEAVVDKTEAWRC